MGAHACSREASARARKVAGHVEGFSRPVALLVAVAVASLAALALAAVSALLYLRRRAAENDRASMLARTVPVVVGGTGS